MSMNRKQKYMLACSLFILLIIIWIFIPPVITTLLFTVVFGKIAQLSTDGLPAPLFYMSGIVIWNYFSSCFSGTSNSLSGNAGLFGKVYFPRIIIPVATLLSGLVRFFIQFILFLCILIYVIIFHREIIYFYNVNTISSLLLKKILS